MKLRRRIFDSLERQRLGEHQERAARNDLRLRRRLIEGGLLGVSYKCGPEVESGPQTHTTPRRSR